jgi:EAL domain-containing protein (putative c-di-GMP-specific phosphodiesterase class I)
MGAAASLVDTPLVSRLDPLMQRFRLEASSLTLEMTESMLMGNAESSANGLDPGELSRYEGQRRTT